MTTVAAPVTSARRTGTSARPPARADSAVRAKPNLRVVPAARARAGRVGTLLALFTVFALVSAVVFHVVLAQNQLQLDQLNTRIAQEQRVYEQRRLTSAVLASPQRIIQEAERLGLVLPAAPPPYLYVDNAPLPSSGDGATADTLTDWTKAKPSLGAPKP
jgi:cell division protein FtsL